MVRKETSQKSGHNSQARSKEESRCQAVLARPKGSTAQSRLGAKKRATHQGMFRSIYASTKKRHCLREGMKSRERLKNK